MAIGERIRELRKLRRLTQKQLAEMTGIAEITIRQYESGKYTPKIAKIQMIASALDTDIGYLLQVEHDDQIDKIIKHFPNTPVIETDEKITMPIITSPKNNQSPQEIFREETMKLYDGLTYNGQTYAYLYLKYLDSIKEFQKVPHENYGVVRPPELPQHLVKPIPPLPTGEELDKALRRKKEGEN